MLRTEDENIVEKFLKEYKERLVYELNKKTLDAPFPEAMAVAIIEDQYKKMIYELRGSRLSPEERIKSILVDIGHSHISYGNLHEDNNQGLQIIKKSLERDLEVEKITEHNEDNTNSWQICPKCMHIIDRWNEKKGFCIDCGQRLKEATE